MTITLGNCDIVVASTNFLLEGISWKLNLSCISIYCQYAITLSETYASVDVVLWPSSELLSLSQV